MKMRLTFLILFFSLGAIANDHYPRNENIDIKHYTFQLYLNDSTDVIYGEASIDILFKNAITEFELDLVGKNNRGKGMTVKSISFNNKSINFSHSNNRVKISLPAKATIGQVLTISIVYSGVPEDGLIISKNKFGDRTFFGDNWPNRAHHWLPVMDHPYDKAGVDFIVTAPAYYEVVGNGIKLEESPINKNQKLTHWHEEADIATKVMVIGVARFAIQRAGNVNGIEVESWVFPQNRKEGFYDYAVAPRVLDFFINHVGAYSYKKLANVQSKTIYGGMENASNIFYYENSVTGKAEVGSLIAHEIAHQWFGNSASENDWHHIWLSEGFATYFTHLYNEFTYGIDKRIADMQKDRQEIIAFYRKNPAPIINTSITNLVELLDVNAYQKGGWVLHMLRQEVGNDVFWRGIREYYRQYKNGNALTSDFQQVMEQTSGKDLSWYFDQWLYRAGFPMLTGTWTYRASTKTVDIEINQIQKEGAFLAALELALYSEKNDLIGTETIKLNAKTQKISVPVSQKVTKIVLDPHANLLFEGDFKNLNK